MKSQKVDFTYFIRMGRTCGLLPNEPIILAVVKNEIADFFNINCRYNTMFIWGYWDASNLHGDIDDLISYLLTSMPSCQPYAKRAKIQISGIKCYKYNQQN